MTDNVLNGKCNGGSPTFGYRSDPATHKYLIDDLQAECVRKIYDMFLSGILISNIVSYLEKQCWKNARGNNFNYNGVERILKNRCYTGEYVFRGTVNPTGFPQIISKETFEQVQEIFRTKKRDFSKSMNSNSLYLLTGILYCSHCGKQLTGETGTSKTGKVYHYYKCYSVKKGLGCKSHSLRKCEIEKLVLDEIKKELLSDRIFNVLTDKLLIIDKEQNKTNAKVTQYEKDLGIIKTKLKTLLQLYQTVYVVKP